MNPPFPIRVAPPNLSGNSRGHPPPCPNLSRGDLGHHGSPALRPDPEELAAQRALRLQLCIARGPLKEDDAGETAIDASVRTLRETLSLPDSKVRRAT